MPSTEMVNNQRIARFKQQITDTLAKENSGFFVQLVEHYEQEHNVPAIEIAGALAKLLQGDEPLLLEERAPQRRGRERNKVRADVGMERFRVEVGHNHRVKPGHIVGAIINETGIANHRIGRITINDDHSIVDLPADIPHETFELLRRVSIFGQPMNISSLGNARNDAGWEEG